ncbi:AI-2E family transporter [Limosilactobacillus fermentum]|uniref:AI-2E family transporter n=1 Tax=Limosilactobacillus fermentum TaxID=1613 RepID=UPI0023E36545|nr:AI-2E family transporter [Limosilactobacillus fermentum]MDF4006888.1 AI-2E family transporter [Limosilactobacillus fermentum]MDF4015851.1 AI-2E family transporter [Limosilactobacillus fermentum]
MTDFWNKFTKKQELRRLVVLLVIVLVLYEARSLMNTILLTFIFTYLIVHWVRLVQRWIPRVPVTLVVLLSYLLLILGLFYVVTDYVPMLVNQLVKMTNSLITFYQSADMHWLMKYLNQFVSSSTLATQARHGVTLAVTTLTNFWTLLVAVAMSVILSFFYTIELRQMNEFSKTFLSSQHLSWFFKDLDFFGKKFVNTFGVVLEAQFFIALTNTALTMIALFFMKMPQIFALGLMVFIMSLVPVAGVIISLVPLSMVGYSVGGIRYIVYLIIVILVIHMIESYVLNPKFMSSRTELPIFYTFVVLLVSEHLFGVWGLIVGVPIFTFLLDIVGVKQIRVHKLPTTQDK